MAVLRMNEISKMEGGELDSKLGELKRELGSELSAAKGVGRTANTGRLKELRRAIARILTFKNSASKQKQTEKTKADAKTEKQIEKPKQETDAKTEKQIEKPKQEAEVKKTNA